MLKVFATDVVVSKGFDNAPALKYNENGDSVRFRIGKKLYDTRCEDNTRWINLSVKAFGPVCERIKKMQLKEGSYVNLIGRLDEDTWTDQNTNEKKSMTVLILDELEYAAGGSGNKTAKDSQHQAQNQPPQNQTQKTPAQKQQNPAPAANPQESENFTGFEPFGGGSFFD